MNHHALRGTGFAFEIVDGMSRPWLSERVSYMARAEQKGSRRPHATRCFTLKLPVWYRADGEIHWRAGMTESISDSETVIRAAHPTASDTNVAIVISLPPAAAELGACLVGRGCVKGAPAVRARSRRSTFAVAVTYRLERAERAFGI